MSKSKNGFAQNRKTLLFEKMALPKTGKRCFLKKWLCPKRENAAFLENGSAQNGKTLLFEKMALPKTEKRCF